MNNFCVEIQPKEKKRPTKWELADKIQPYLNRGGYHSIHMSEERKAVIHATLPKNLIAIAVTSKMYIRTINWLLRISK